MTIAALQSVWQTIQGFDLTAENKRWIADHLYEQARQEETFLPYTMDEINTRIDRAEADVAAGRVLSRTEASQRMKDYIHQHL